MAYENIVLIAIAALSVFGTLGGVPQILRTAKPRPHLRITEATISKLPNDNYKYLIHMEVENESKSMSRNRDATNLTTEYFLMDKDGVQRGSASNQVLCPCLLAGTRIQKDAEAFHSLLPEGNPYSIVFRVKCIEGEEARKTVMYDAKPVVYG